MIALVCGKWFPFYPATGNTYAHSPPSESIPSSHPWRCTLLFSPPNPKPTSSRPEQRRPYRPLRSGEIPVWRDPRIFVFALAVARSFLPRPCTVISTEANGVPGERFCSLGQSSRSHREQRSGETRFSTCEVSQPKSRCLFSPTPPKPLGLTLTKAGVQPEGRNDPSIALALAVARCKPPKTPAKTRVKPPNHLTP
jgi:hypothetical protein